METFDYNESGMVSGMESEPTPSQPGMDVGEGIPAEPGFGPIGPVTPALPSEGEMTPSQPMPGRPTPSQPSFGRPTPSIPSRPSAGWQGSGNCTNCSYISWPSGNVGILWTWGTLSPFFSTSSEIAHLRFYNAAAIREPLDIYLNGRMVVSDLDYMNYTRFLHIIPGTYRLTVYRRTNPGEMIINTNIRVNSGTSNTLVILGTIGNYSVQMLTS